MDPSDDNHARHPEVRYLMQTPWCAQHLASTGADDESTTPPVVRVHANRTVLPTQENQFVGGTLNSPATIAAWVNVYARPQRRLGFRIRQFVSLIALRDGMIGFPGALHGGAASLLVDEVTGMHIASQRDPDRPLNKDFRTAYLKTEYLKPIPVPGAVLVRSEIERVDGRKHWVKATIEDGSGQVLARGEVLYVALKEKAKL
ncbi:hypothetical protein MGG_11096 [Pyricularia oryzae 70-15]|uniref:Thioesterase domain-containing protein n=4 Tax=Pyricularia oryzae TaxID=318829 RepID=G5EH69_PYRO7|nr:uncharacterized protein MGG_11096 [Pyricularia oryzae 70-15]AEX97144.1 hypothetical protein 7bg7.9 [Pyricularia oryzae]ELQ33386.1 hypothetical protein OOU_Y34scaffold00962g10 [Pyricularia oryzae Y34]EAQ70824.1 hypothetical protein MGCH7_ch7g231 [Pyricularia oryzae 70-15]EHA46547.1 hypothetical protein MGG_11096 [Pyricularia oryzae 70-15]KAI7910742.1 hypothetical protein M9X92_010898 [Pyricularia oryzae]